MSFSQNYLEQTSQIASSLDSEVIENIAEELSALRKEMEDFFLLVPEVAQVTPVMQFVILENLETLNAIHLAIIFQNLLPE